MGTVMIRCPISGHAISTEIETELSVFQRLPHVATRLLRCPSCGGEHMWTTKDAWLADPPFMALAASDR